MTIKETTESISQTIELPIKSSKKENSTQRNTKKAQLNNENTTNKPPYAPPSVAPSPSTISISPYAPTLATV